MATELTLRLRHIEVEFCKRIFLHQCTCSNGCKWKTYIVGKQEAPIGGTDADNSASEALESTDSLERLGRTRLLNSKLFTWHFFRNLLEQFPKENDIAKSSFIQRMNTRTKNVVSEVRRLQASQGSWSWDRVEALHIMRHSVPPPHRTFWIDDESRQIQLTDVMMLWARIDRTADEHDMLLDSYIPDKLLKRPFTPDKVDFLHTLLCVGRLDIATPALATTALHDAIRDEEYHLVWTLLTVANVDDTDVGDLLHTAIVDADCAPTMVFMIMDEWSRHARDCRGHCGHPAMWEAETDLLDKILWNWADRQRKQKNWRGGWVETNLSRLGAQLRPVAPEHFLTVDEKDRAREFGVHAMF